MSTESEFFKKENVVWTSLLKLFYYITSIKGVMFSPTSVSYVFVCLLTGLFKNYQNDLQLTVKLTNPYNFGADTS